MLSSANRRILDGMFSLMSLMYNKKSICPRTEPCGTPDITSVVSNMAPLTDTRCLRFDRKDVIQLCVLPVIPYDVSFDRRRLCGTFQRLWQNLGGLHQVVFYYLMPSSSHGLSLLVETRKTVPIEIHVENER